MHRTDFNTLKQAIKLLQMSSDLTIITPQWQVALSRRDSSHISQQEVDFMTSNNPALPLAFANDIQRLVILPSRTEYVDNIKYWVIDTDYPYVQKAVFVRVPASLLSPLFEEAQRVGIKHPKTTLVNVLFSTRVPSAWWIQEKKRFPIFEIALPNGLGQEVASQDDLTIYLCDGKHALARVALRYMGKMKTLNHILSVAENVVVEEPSPVGVYKGQFMWAVVAYRSTYTLTSLMYETVSFTIEGGDILAITHPIPHHLTITST